MEKEEDDNLTMAERVRDNKKRLLAKDVKIIVKRVKQFAKKVKPHNKRAHTTRSKQKVILEKVAEASKKKRKESEEFRIRGEPSDVEAIDLESDEEKEVEKVPLIRKKKTNASGTASKKKRIPSKRTPEKEEESKFIWNC
ncbi:protein PXR1-like [Nicotiana tomentosiformis]|uniref:protein PXR1-like n=1 Tax=Nicotiana tomentosiformis TaxID=4098 RepID=UPI0008790BBF|nr:uncharacterized protein LOC108947729 [Nicotiana tomentosiformis]